MSTPIYTQDQVNRDLGTNTPTRTLEQTQQPPQTTGPIPYQAPATGVQVFDDGSSIQTFDDGSTLATGTDGKTSATNAVEVIPATTRGAGSANDDNPYAAPSTVQYDVAVNSSANSNRVSPSPNVLDQYASYTYSLSWYALTPAQYKAMVDTAKINPTQWSLLMQSGGAAVGGNRNKYFGLDYYMDNLEIETSFADNGPSAASTISFTVMEPNGMTLLKNLNSALRDLLGQPTGSVAAAAQYVMVIRFYGYDQFGNLVTNVSQVPGTPGVPSNSNAVVVKYFPFTITDFGFEAANRTVEYKIKGTCPQYKYNKGSALGSTPTTIELTGETVGEILNGKATKNTTAPATDGRTTTDKPAVVATPKYPKSALGNAVVTGGYSEETGMDFGNLSS